MPRHHGSLTQAGKVRLHTPVVQPKEKGKSVQGRALKRKIINRQMFNQNILSSHSTKPSSKFWNKLYLTSNSFLMSQI
jgi:ribosomal protein S30